MTAPLAPDARSGGARTTRRQLDDLDALLKRMLDLPVRPSSDPEMDAADDVPVAPPRAPWPPAASPEYTPPPPPRQQPARTAPPERLPEPPVPGPARSYPSAYMVVESTTPDFADMLGRPGVAPPAAPPAPPPPPPVPPPPAAVSAEDEEAAREAEELARLRERLEQQGDWVPLQSSWQPSEQTWKPLAASWSQKPPETPAAAPRPLPPVAPTISGPSRIDHPSSAGAPFPTLSATNIPVQGGPAPALHRTPASMDMPWSLGPAAPPPPPRREDPASWANAPAGEVIPPPPPPSMSPAAALPTPVMIPAPAPAPPRATPAALLPLVWFNAAFDVCTWPLGPVGSALRSQGGRNLLGTLGLLGLAAAAALAAADGLGWQR